MKKRLTFFLASNSGAPVRQITIPKIAIGLVGGLVLLCLLAIGIVFIDYIHLKKKSFQVHQLSDQISTQNNELAGQRSKIKEFAGKINTLKTKLSTLDQFEQKIRIIANIEKDSDAENVFGVGGSIPSDIDTNISLKERHNAMLREMHSQLDILDAAFIRQQESFSSLLDYLEDKRRLLASTPAIRPMNGGWVTSRFEYRKSPFTGRREFHHGLDIAARIGTPIMASADGVVIYSGRKGSLGNAIIIDHGHGMVSRYGHMSKCLKKRGENVKREDIIGNVGNTGLSTGPHLHYEIRINGVPVNPEKYIIN
ncbi:MAG: M23 family metallopeptidase [Thermodesulfobacteriota bacterium]|nr:M23 family metallopeptidase [Thermodesulfobacteriota bacterium]